MYTPITPSTLALIFGMPGWGEILLLALVGLLIFGKRLPEVGRSVGRGILEFKKGLSGIDDEPPTAPKTNPEPPKLTAPDTHPENPNHST